MGREREKEREVLILLELNTILLNMLTRVNLVKSVTS